LNVVALLADPVKVKLPELEDNVRDWLFKFNVELVLNVRVFPPPVRVMLDPANVSVFPPPVSVMLDPVTVNVLAVVPPANVNPSVAPVRVLFAVTPATTKFVAVAPPEIVNPVGLAVNVFVAVTESADPVTVRVTNELEPKEAALVPPIEKPLDKLPAVIALAWTKLNNKAKLFPDSTKPWPGMRVFPPANNDQAI
jgi:hypothetical protein